VTIFVSHGQPVTQRPEKGRKTPKNCDAGPEQTVAALPDCWQTRFQSMTTGPIARQSNSGRKTITQ